MVFQNSETSEQEVEKNSRLEANTSNARIESEILAVSHI